MPRPLDVDAIFKEFKAIHGEKYNYSKSKITDSRVKIKILCKKHGVFLQRIDHHRSGSGCQKCRSDKIKAMMSTSNRDYIDAVNSMHEGKYDYSLTEYENTNTKIKIICKIHGVFEQRAKNHLQGRGCRKCATDKIASARRGNFTDLKTRSKLVHNNKYTYPEQDYISTHKHIKIQCNLHGEFLQTPANHLSGRGCPLCAKFGFRVDKNAVLYILVSDCYKFIKVGITGHMLQRHGQLRRSTPFKFSVLQTLEIPGSKARQIEAFTHNQLRSACLSGFNGATEWFHYDKESLNEINSRHFGAM